MNIETLRSEVLLRTVKGVQRADRYYYVPCPRCGQERPLRKCDIDSKQCKYCATSDAGKKGFEKGVQLYGKKHMVKRLQKRLLANPSSLERIFSQQLGDAGIDYDREVLVEENERCAIIDFVIAGTLAVEINGSYVHQFHAERDSLKCEMLTRLGYTVIVLSDDEVKSGAGLEKVVLWLQ